MSGTGGDGAAHDAETTFEELMAEPALADVSTIAVTVPGMGGTPAPADLGIESLAGWQRCPADPGRYRVARS